MSWNAHTDYVFNQLPGQIKYLYLGGPDGSKWGESGTPVNISASEAGAGHNNPTQSLMVGGKKHMFLRQMDDITAYNAGGQGVALLKANSYVAIAFAGDGFKAEQCCAALDKLKAYLGGIGYN